MTADVEDNYMVAQANEPLTEDNKFARPKVNGRYRDQILEIEREKIDFMDVSPKMVVSVATACIPFLENDDANRALWVQTCRDRLCRCSRLSLLSLVLVWSTKLVLIQRCCCF